MTTARMLPALLAALVFVAPAGCVVVTESPEGQAPGVPDQDSPGGPGTADSAQGDADSEGGDGYTFLHARDDGEPVRWSTCEPIRYVIREEGEPEGARGVFEESIQRISEVSGLEFSFEGTTDETPRQDRQPYLPDRYLDQWAPVLIAYSDPDEYPALQGQAAGFGGAAFVRAGGAPPRYVSGQAVFDADQLQRMGGEDALRAVMLHELAHVVGLGHVQDRDQLMNPVQYGRGVTDLQEGDIAGLEALGDGECYEPIEPGGIRR